MRSQPLRYLAGILALAALYFAAARLGLSMFGFQASLAEQVTLVWPPSGISLVAILLFGYRVWPGIALGAFLANATAHETVPVACGIAVGNTLEALLGAWLLQHLAGFGNPLERLKDILGLVVLAAGLSTTVSASVGVTSLCLGGVKSWDLFGPLWLDWWLGDAMGDVVMAPVLLTWATRYPRRWRLSQVAEAGALLIGLVTASVLVFTRGELAFGTHFPLTYAVFPFVVWAALRFGQLGSATVTFITLSIAVGGVVIGSGPFAGRETVHEALLLLQLYIAVVAVTALLLSAAISERKTVERTQAAGYAVTKVLGAASALSQATCSILQAICETLEWELGALWAVDSEAQVLRCVELWHCPTVEFSRFEAASRQKSLAPGIDMPGRVWASGRPAWVADIPSDPNCPRAPVAAQEGLHSALGFPILVDNETVGVIEFFSRKTQEPDEALLKLLAAVGGQIGLFLKRSRADEALRRSHGVLQAVIEGTTDAVFVKDLQGRYLMINSAGARLLGKAVAEVLGKDDTELFSPETAQGIMERDRQVMASGITRTYEDLGTAAGVTRTYLSTKGPYRDHEGKVIGLIGISRDITDRKAAEETLKEADRRKDEFLAMLAHELRNPLAPIRNAVQVLRLLGPASPKQNWAQDVMDRQVQQLTRLVDDLLDVSRITRGKVKLQKEAVDLATVVGRAVETSRPLIESRRHQCVVNLAPEPIWLQADPTRLAQVLANLLNNAAKYTAEGGRVLLTTTREGHEAVIKVRDTGMGIPAEMLPHVFDLFTQGERALDRSQGGLGIGLTLVRSLVELHGGSVQAFSAGPDQGSEFVVRLPVLPRFQARSPARSPARFPARSASKGGATRKRSASARRRVLVVEDNADAAMSLALLLQFEGHEVRMAHDGPAALELARTFGPEVVLLDIGLPGLDGYEVARRLREDFKETVLLVAQTGYGQDEDRRRSQEAGFDHHLVKPVDPHALMVLLDQFEEEYSGPGP